MVMEKGDREAAFREKIFLILEIRMSAFRR